MTRLRRAFDDLISRHPRRGADDLWAAAGDAAAPTTRHRRPTPRALAAAVLVVAAVTAGAVAAMRWDREDVPDVTTGPAATTAVSVFFSPADDPTCSAVEARPRRVPADDDPLAGALTELLAGPTADEAADGLTSWFSSATAGSLRSVEVVDGVALVDLEPFAATIPNASTACGSTSLLAQLDATATARPGVERALYSFDGSAEAFYAWLQMDVPGGAGAPDVDLGRPIVAASGAGVDLLVGDTVVPVESGPASVAYATPERAGRSGDERWVVATQAGTGPVVVRRADGTESYGPGADAHTLVLLDVGRLADDRAVVLVAEQVGSGLPDAVRERLVLIDVATGERTVVVDRPAWESSHLAAEVLPDGAVIGLLSTEARVDRVRWEIGLEAPVWTAPVTVDEAVDLAVDDQAGHTTIVRSQPAAGTVWIEEVAFDLTTGAAVGERSLRPELGAPIDAGARCTDVFDDGSLLCWSAVAAPVVVTPDPAGPARVRSVGSLATGAHAALVR